MMKWLYNTKVGIWIVTILYFLFSLAFSFLAVFCFVKLSNRDIKLHKIVAAGSLIWAVYMISFISLVSMEICPPMPDVVVAQKDAYQWLFLLVWLLILSGVSIYPMKKFLSFDTKKSFIISIIAFLVVHFSNWVSMWIFLPHTIYLSM